MGFNQPWNEILHWFFMWRQFLLWLVDFNFLQRQQKNQSPVAHVLPLASSVRLHFLRQNAPRRISSRGNICNGRTNLVTFPTMFQLTTYNSGHPNWIMAELAYQKRCCCRTRDISNQILSAPEAADMVEGVLCTTIIQMMRLLSLGYLT